MKKAVTLVERFEDLAEGDPVLLKACRLCGGEHRGTLGALHYAAKGVIVPDDKITLLDVFPLEPPQHADEPAAPLVEKHRWLGIGITRVQVDAGRVYRLA